MYYPHEFSPHSHSTSYYSTIKIIGPSTSISRHVPSACTLSMNSLPLLCLLRIPLPVPLPPDCVGIVFVKGLRWDYGIAGGVDGKCAPRSCRARSKNQSITSPGSKIVSKSGASPPATCYPGACVGIGALRAASTADAQRVASMRFYLPVLYFACTFNESTARLRHTHMHLSTCTLYKML